PSTDYIDPPTESLGTLGNQDNLALDGAPADGRKGGRGVFKPIAGVDVGIEATFLRPGPQQTHIRLMTRRLAPNVLAPEDANQSRRFQKNEIEGKFRNLPSRKTDDKMAP